MRLNSLGIASAANVIRRRGDLEAAEDRYDAKGIQRLNCIISICTMNR